MKIASFNLDFKKVGEKMKALIAENVKKTYKSRKKQT